MIDSKLRYFFLACEGVFLGYAFLLAFFAITQVFSVHSLIVAGLVLSGAMAVTGLFSFCVHMWQKRKLFYRAAAARTLSGDELERYLTGHWGFRREKNETDVKYRERFIRWLGV